MNTQDFIFSLPELKEYLAQKGIDIEKAHLPHVQTPNFSLQIPKYYVDLINWYDQDDPLRKMVVYDELEEDVKEYELTDPIGDKPHSPVAGIVQRYPDRCLLMLTNFCAVHCRFCFRRNLLSTHLADYEKALQYIEHTPTIWEVILSGGDPFMLTDIFLQKILLRLGQIKHLKVIRFHTRTPAVYPMKVTEQFCEIISKSKTTIVVLHINHPREITKEFVESIAHLKKAGIMVLSQTVLMRGVNDDVKTLETLFKNLVEIGVKPYYLHHLDLAAGTDHFRVSLKKGKSLIQHLRGRISGVCMPEYVIDTPGGYGKIPVFWFKHISEKEYTATSYEGKDILYVDHFSQ